MTLPFRSRSVYTGGVLAVLCWWMLPQDFDPAKKYPVYVAIYGGPGANTVNDSWGGSTFMWQQYLAQEGYIVVSCDPPQLSFTVLAPGPP